MFLNSRILKIVKKIQMKRPYHVIIKRLKALQKQIQFVGISGCCVIKIIQWNFYKIKIKRNIH